MGILQELRLSLSDPCMDVFKICAWLHGSKRKALSLSEESNLPPLSTFCYLNNYWSMPPTDPQLTIYHAD